MNKIFVIFKREFLTRIKNKSFIVMTLLGPILMVLFYAGIFFVATRDSKDQTKREISLIDKSGFFINKIDTFQNYTFTKTESAEIAKKKIIDKKSFGYLEINDKDLQKIDSVNWIAQKSLSISQNLELRGLLSKLVYEDRLKSLGMRDKQIDSLSPKVVMQTLEINDTGSVKDSLTSIKTGIAFALAFVIYIFIFIYGSMVMRGTLEEKTNRIVEVIVSSVKPFQLMMGKILGVAAVGLTQFVAWILLGLLLSTITFSVIGASKAKDLKKITNTSISTKDTEKVKETIGEQTNVLDKLSSLPAFKIILTFVIFFAGGFLLYGSMFAAIGSAVNQDTEVQQFMLPVSLPLVFGLVIAQNSVFQDPNGPMAQIFSMIPFTSPIVMMVRAPFDVPYSELFLSMGILIITFLFFVWLSARIYRVGILMYGKKPGWKDLFKWILIK